VLDLKEDIEIIYIKEEIRNEIEIEIE